MQPFFFGSQDEPLLGVYHPPEGPPVDGAVLLCYPGPEEYMRCHWPFRRLAAILARRGFHALRFDYFATGDSAGESGQGTPARWVEDIRVAAAELRDQAGVSALSAVGLRLGGALLAAASPGLGLQQAVLWEPVIAGDEYLRELRAYQARFALLPKAPRCGPHELLGLPFSPELESATAAIDLLNGPVPEARRVDLISSQDRPASRSLETRLRSAGRNAAITIVPDEAPGGASEGALVSLRVLETIADLLSGSKV